MNKVLFFLLFLGIIFSFYHKYTTVIENLKCDPNKAKVYPESGKRSEKECQRLGKGKNSRNLKSFEKQLDEVKELLSKVKTEILDMINKHKENSSNINKAADSLNCYEDKRTGDFDCDKEGEGDGEDYGEEVDLSADKSRAIRGAGKIKPVPFGEKI